MHRWPQQTAHEYFGLVAAEYNGGIGGGGAQRGAEGAGDAGRHGDRRDRQHRCDPATVTDHVMLVMAPFSAPWASLAYFANTPVV